MEVKIIKVTDKGQISLPIGLRESLKIKQGDELLITSADNTLIIKKIKRDDFSDLLKHSEKVAKKLWIIRRMRCGIMYEQGEIIIVPFPFSDLRKIQKRPVLVLSKRSDNIVFDDIISCGITSNVKESKYSVFIENKNLDFGHIPVRSRIKVDKLFTLDKKIVEKSIGKINKETFNKVKKEFFNLL